MSDPAVILHKGQKLVVESDTTELFQALKAGKLEEVKETGKQESKTGRAEPPRNRTDLTGRKTHSRKTEEEGIDSDASIH